MPYQSTSTILMVRPANFGFNIETAATNIYQKPDNRHPIELNAIACEEFDEFVNLLRKNKIHVLVMEDTSEPVKTDAVFPNNWFSTHEDGRIVLYPMFSPNRRLERRRDLVEFLFSKGFQVNEIIDLSFFEQDGQFLEGTGSIVLDRLKKIAYACYSVRTHVIPLGYFGQLMGYKVIAFDAVQTVEEVPIPIYHTNVMMHLGSYFAVVCLDSIATATDKLKLQKSMEETGKKIIPITPNQKFNFAGNMLEVRNEDSEKFTIMSKSAYDSFSKVQIQTIEKYTQIIKPNIPTIEKLGGGSTRCMMAEIFLPLM